MSFKIVDGSTLEQNFVQDYNVIDRWVGGSRFGCGYNVSGEVGDSTAVAKSSPAQVGSLNNWSQIVCGYRISAGIKTDGTLWVCGYNSNGELGLGVTGANRSSPVVIPGVSVWSQVTISPGKVYNTGAIRADGTLWTWGGGSNTTINGGTIQLGQGHIATPTSTPVQVTGLNWKQVSFGGGIFAPAAAVKNDGTLWTWGGNKNGELGLAGNAVPVLTGTSTSTPIQVGSLTNWKQVSCGDNHIAAIKNDGTLWVWGHNPTGNLGDGTLLDKSSPIQIGSLTTWKQVSCGSAHTVGIKIDGTLWAWGDNTFGQLGDGTVTTKSTPIQIGSLVAWKQASASGGKGSNTLAVAVNGTLWSWGLNTRGQLGLGDIISRSSPTQVGALTNWKQVSCGYVDMAAITYCEDYLT